MLAPARTDAAHAVAILDDGTLLAVDGPEVVVIDDGETSPWVELPFTLDNIEVGPDGRVYVSTASTGEIISFDADGGDARTVLEGSDGATF